MLRFAVGVTDDALATRRGRASTWSIDAPDEAR
jgi:hypothetical protein